MDLMDRTNYLLPCLALILVAMPIPKVSAEEIESSSVTHEWRSDWEEEDADDGFTATCRTHQSKIKQCIFRTEIDVPVAALFSVVRDVDNFTEWAESVAVSTRAPELESADEIVVYTEYTLSGAYDRFAVTRYDTEFAPEEKRVQVSFQTIDETAPIIDQDLMRFPLMQGYWRFTELPNGNTEIEHQSLTLPGGSVQSTLYYFYNNAYIDASFETIRRLVERAKQPPYTEAKLVWETK